MKLISKFSFFSSVNFLILLATLVSPRWSSDTNNVNFWVRKYAINHVTMVNAPSWWWAVLDGAFENSESKLCPVQGLLPIQGLLPRALGNVN